jgi:hypothetical protein
MTKNHRYGVISGAVLVAAMAISFGAAGMSQLVFWHMPADGTGPNRAGAAAIYGTGGKSDWGITCAHCHSGAKGLIGATFVASPSWQKVNNVDAYKPGQKYDITVTLTNEQKVPSARWPHTQNGFAATFEDANGKPKGTLQSDVLGNSSASCPPTAPMPIPAAGTTYVYGDCHGILFLQRDDNKVWKFSWTAPPMGAGDITVYYGVVDGDSPGKGGSKDDDVLVRNFKLVPGN